MPASDEWISPAPAQDASGPAEPVTLAAASPAVIDFAARSARAGGLLIDMDGTLVNSEPANQAAYRALYAAHGWHLDEAVLPLFTGRTSRDSFRDIPGPWHAEGLDIDALIIEVNSLVDMRAYPPVPIRGAAQFVRLFERACVVTSAMREWAREGVELAGLSWDGLHLVSAEDVSRGKPHPEPYVRGAQVAGVDPASCLVVEDTPAGVRSALAAGVGMVLGVTTGYRDAALLEAGAHATMPDFTALHDALRPVIA